MTTTESSQVAALLRDLRERAKELDCLYRVDALLSTTERPLATILQGIVESLPPAWQYPADCQAQLTYGDLVLRTSGFQPTPWMQSAAIVVDGAAAGSVEVCYLRAQPTADEGPFLKEERKVIETLAQRISSHLTHRRLRATMPAVAASAAPDESRVVLDFLRDTDPGLLAKISRKLINQLSWSGVSDAKRLLERSGVRALGGADSGADNRPLWRAETPASIDVTEEALALARRHMSEADQLRCLAT